MQEVREKVAVVTGGGSGIGSGMCSAFASAGMKIAVADVDEEAAESKAQSLRDAGAQAIAVPTDVRDAKAVEALAARTESEFGAIHLLCNNAGVLLGGAMLEHTEGDWSWVLGVNVMGVVHGSQTFGKRFAEQREGHIVNTASVGGFMGSKDMVIYSTSKFAVVGYTEALRAELEPHGVGVSTLCPGPVATALGTADRLRPDEYGSSAATSETVSPFIADGLDPMKVGETVLAGVLANREYIFTDRLFRDAFAQRFERVLAAFDDAP